VQDSGWLPDKVKPGVPKVIFLLFGGPVSFACTSFLDYVEPGLCGYGICGGVAGHGRIQQVVRHDWQSLPFRQACGCVLASALGRGEIHQNLNTVVCVLCRHGTSTGTGSSSSRRQHTCSRPTRPSLTALRDRSRGTRVTLCPPSKPSSLKPVTADDTLHWM
jgi:hypothetical protein